MLWNADAENGFLSYSKMKYVINQRQVRKLSVDTAESEQVNSAKKVVYEKYEICGTDTGSFTSICCNDQSRQSSISENLGAGMSIYFKQLKTLVCMFIAFTVLSIPAFILFWSGKSHNGNLLNDQSIAFNDLILALSLGNLGERALNINELDLYRRQQHIEMFCDTGVIGEITKHGIAMVERYDNEMDYFEDTFCGTEISEENRQVIEDECYNQQFCHIKFKIDSKPLIEKCRG